MNPQQEVQTFLSALQATAKVAVGCKQMNVTDNSNRLEWMVGVGNDRYSLWHNPDGSWGWNEFNGMFM